MSATTRTGITESNGIKYCYLNGQFHSTERPAVEFQNGDTLWYFYDLLHRLDGPAVEQDGNKFWYKHGKRHRTDGPAVVYANGYQEWCINGKSYTEKEFKNKVRKIGLERELFTL